MHIQTDTKVKATVMTRFLLQTIVGLSRIKPGWTKSPLKNKPVSCHIFTYSTSVTKLKASRPLVKCPGLLLQLLMNVNPSNKKSPSFLFVQYLILGLAFYFFFFSNTGCTNTPLTTPLPRPPPTFAGELVPTQAAQT